MNAIHFPSAGEIAGRDSNLAAIAAEAPAIGTPCDRPGGAGTAYVVAVAPARGGTFTIGGGSLTPMARDRFAITIADDRGVISEVSENIAAPMIYRARGVPPISEAEAAALWERAKAQRELSRQRAAMEASEREAARKASKEELKRLTPSWAQAAIVAELHEDASDSMSDYHNHRTLRTVVIGWSRHKRDLFPELRKAAASFPETAALADAPQKAEHREKYSMGAGFYLKNGWRDSTGWCVRKRRVDWLDFPGLEFSDSAKRLPATPTAEPAAPTPIGGNRANAGRFTIERHTHTKHGWDMWICVLSERVERAEYDALLSTAKALGGWYSRAWGNSPAGFAFKSEAKALQFIGGPDGTGGGEDAPAAPASAAPAVSKPAPVNVADKLRTIAEGLQPEIAHKFADRRENTPKQQRQAAEAQQEGRNLERAQKIARALANCHDAGTVPACLAKVSTKAALLNLAKEGIDRGRAGYYDAGSPTGQPYPHRSAAELAQAVAAWALIDPAAERQAREAEELKQKIAALKFAKIPGYFPTPAALVAEMIEAADLPERANVIEPSAGSGAIADALRDAGHHVACYERHSSLCEILHGKGFPVFDGDFLTREAPAKLYDAAVMNPPFENGQDLAHVRHAWGFVRPGGSLVAIMGAGVRFRQDRRYSEFREWADEIGGEWRDIPAGTFKESGTGVASVMLIIRKGAGA